MEKIREKFDIIKDLRHQGYVEHKIQDILMIIMRTVLCVIDELSEIPRYAQNKREFLKKTFGIDKIPSKPTLRRVINMINGGKVDIVIIEIMRENIVAVDEKATRSTAKKGNLTQHCRFQ